MRTIFLMTLNFIPLSVLLLSPKMAFTKTKPVTHTVAIEGMKFSPESLTIQIGDSVVWVNKDIVPHTATGLKKEFESGEITSGKSWKYVARIKGNIPYVCSYHPTMNGTLTVK